MGNLIRAEFYRLRRRPHSVLGMALILLLGVSLLTVSCALPPQVGSAATLLQSISSLSVSGMFFAVWCAAAASSGVSFSCPSMADFTSCRRCSRFRR